MRAAIAFFALLLPITEAGASDRPAGSPSPRAMRSLSWQEQISEPDRKRLAGLWSAWTRSLNEAGSAGLGSDVAALGAMAVPEAALAASPPPPGAYRCRSVKLGNRGEGRAITASALDVDAPVPCTITAKGSLLWLEQAGGAQRVGGTLYPDGDRMIFLGSKALKGEVGLMAYGSDASRDQVGVLRAFGDQRWRLELPWPMWQSNLEIIEIVPA